MIPAADWFRLPIKLRRRWWQETDYGRLPPSDELMSAVRAAIATANQQGGSDAQH